MNKKNFIKILQQPDNLSEKELSFLKQSLPNSVNTVAEMKKLLEEQMK